MSFINSRAALTLTIAVLGLSTVAGCLTSGPNKTQVTNEIQTLETGVVEAVLKGDRVTVTATSYVADLKLARTAAADATIVSGSMGPPSDSHAFAQGLRLVDRSGAVSQAPPLAPVVDQATLNPSGTVSSVLQLRIVSGPVLQAGDLRTFRGDVTITFLPRAVTYAYAFIAPTSAASAVPPGVLDVNPPPIQMGLQSTLRVGLPASAEATGVLLPDGTVKAGDDGSALDAFETAGHFERGGVYAASTSKPSMGVFRAEKHISANNAVGATFRSVQGTATVTTTFIPGATGASPLRGNLEEMGVADLLLFGDVGATPATLHHSFVDLTKPKNRATDLDRDHPEKSNVVVAVVDTGINPYHADFVNPLMNEHPSTYIKGYPKDTPAINLTFDAPTVAQAIKADEATWKAVKNHTLYWIPGTKIIGAYSADDQYNPDKDVPKNILDNNGHGTGSTSVSTGYIHGANPDALLVIVEGFSGLQWAMDQPWIDIVSNSWGTLGNVPLGYPHGFAEARSNGQVVLFAAGNGFSNYALVGDRDLTATSAYTATSDVVVVGAVSPRNGQDYNWHAIPVDVSSYGMHWPSGSLACVDCQDYFSGTSCATPVTAGSFSLALLRAREALKDTDEGWRGNGTLAAGAAAGGLLADGKLSRQELVDAMEKTAQPQPFSPEGFLDDPITYPHTEAYYVYVGYGIVNSASATRAADVLTGKVAMPDRSDVDRFMMVRHTVQDALWSVIPDLGV